MSSPFRFKEFEVHQDQSAMKVGTDGVLLGAWANVEGRKKILDIGTGTGLIALMLAQRNRTALIDAVEIDPSAFLQAEQNFLLSPWRNRLKAIHSDFEAYQANCSYDLIITNPPYFNGSFKPLHAPRQLARHSDHFSLKNWLFRISTLLTPNGKLMLIIPTTNFSNFEAIYNQTGFSLTRICEVFPNATKPCKRLLLELSLEPRKNGKIIPENIIIELSQRHQYSNEYIALTKDFYLLF